MKRCGDGDRTGAENRALHCQRDKGGLIKESLLQATTMMMNGEPISEEHVRRDSKVEFMRRRGVESETQNALLIAQLGGHTFWTRYSHFY